MQNYMARRENNMRVNKIAIFCSNEGINQISKSSVILKTKYDILYFLVIFQEQKR